MYCYEYILHMINKNNIQHNIIVYEIVKYLFIKSLQAFGIFEYIQLTFVIGTFLKNIIFIS